MSSKSYHQILVKTSGNRTLTSHEWPLNTQTEKLHDIHKELAGVSHGQVEGLA